jgi:hypothetical protein
VCNVPDCQGQSFIEIAKYWAREMQPRASEEELLALLEQAWWLGEVPCTTAVSRLKLLQGMFQARDRLDLGIVFVQDGDRTAPLEVTELEDTGARVDLRPRIPVPKGDVSDWDERACEPAFQALSQTSSMEHYPDVAPSLAAWELTYEEFCGWCKTRGFAKPKFWRPRDTSSLLEKPKRGRPSEYNWIGVRRRLIEYAKENGPVQNLSELLQKCADFARELHPQRKVPDDSTIRAAIARHGLYAAAGMAPGN